MWKYGFGSLGAALLALSLALLPASANAAFPRPAQSAKGMVASPHRFATAAGVEMLEKGGNAVDAAVATAFAISVTLPYSAGIGGGGFMLYLDNAKGEVRGLDFREKAPAAATRDMYVGPDGKADPKLSTDGYLSVAVPGTVAGLYEAHQKYGKLKWADVVAPAIRLADEGFEVTELYGRFVNWRKDVLSRFPASAAVFLKKNGEPYAPGERFVQKDLAKTLRRISKDPRDFYSGETAKAIAADMAKNGGLVTLKDMESYRPTWRKPVCGWYRQHRVCSMAPPSSGGVHLVEMLNILEQEPLAERGFHHPDSLHFMIEAMRTAYADRATHLGDPDFVDVPVEGLIDREYADVRRKEIPRERARRSTEVVAAPSEMLRKESHDTSHLTVVDKDKNAVSLTFTVNYGFGSGVVVPGTGILLNDEMDDFSAAPGQPNAYGLVGGEANSIAPNKVPLSSMSPTIVMKDKHFAFAGGSPGGSTIITTALQIVLHVVDYDMNAAEAVAAPRLHHQWLPDVVKLERLGFDPATKAALTARGHLLEDSDGWGNASCIILREDGLLEGSADPRGEGTAAGPSK